MKPKKKSDGDKPKVDSSDPSTWPEHLTNQYIYGSRNRGPAGTPGPTGKKKPAKKKKAAKKKPAKKKAAKKASPKKVVIKGQVIAEKKAKRAEEEAKSGKPRMGLCKDKAMFTKLLKEELSDNIAKEGVKVNLSSRLKEDLDLDSLESIEMLLDLEDKYGVEIDNTLMDFNKIHTVKHLRDFLFERTLFPEDIVKRDKEMAKVMKKRAKEKDNVDIQMSQIFSEEYSSGEYSDSVPSHINAEEEMKKIDEEEEKNKTPIPTSGSQF